MPSDLPILYSFRRCPYAMRARLALAHCAVQCEVREVQLANKPEALLEVSPKATVPVLCLPTGQVLDESLQIMQWATQQQDLTIQCDALKHDLVIANDTDFKYWLDRYKYFDRYPEQSQLDYWQQLIPHLQKLETTLMVNRDQKLVLSEYDLPLVDWAIFPFIRQCYFVDRARFAGLELRKLNEWLEGQLSAKKFIQLMRKQSFWYAEGDPTSLLLETI